MATRPCLLLVETLEYLSGVGRSSQRNYEERIGVDVQSNFAVGDLSTKRGNENAPGPKGQALFDSKIMRPARQEGKNLSGLPNSYSGQHRHRPRAGRSGSIGNSKTWIYERMPGNVGERGDASAREDFIANGKLAGESIRP